MSACGGSAHNLPDLKDLRGGVEAANETLHADIVGAYIQHPTPYTRTRSGELGFGSRNFIRGPV